jgi:hypothetical protein
MSLVYLVRPRNEETRAQSPKKKGKKKKKEAYNYNTHSFARILFLMRRLRSESAIFVPPVYSQLTVQYLVRGRKMQSQERPVLSRSHSFSSAYHSTKNDTGRRKPRSTASVGAREL